MGKLVLALAGAGVVLAILGWDGYRVASSVKAEPNVLSCAQLGRYGFGDNAYVRMTDFRLASDYAYSGSDKTRHDTAWLAAMPKDVPALTVRVILKVNNVSQPDIAELGRERAVEGVVVSEVLAGQHRTLLEQRYPGLNWDQVKILHVGRKPGSAGGYIAMMVIGGY